MEKNISDVKEHSIQKEHHDRQRHDNNSIVNSHIDKFNLKEHSLDDVATPLDIGYEIKQ